MNTFLIYVGIALIILIASILIFKPEFSMITGTTNQDSRIMSITQTGDLVLSDNTVQNINDYISKMQSDLSDLTKSISDTKTSLTQQIADAKSSALSTAAGLYQPKGDYLRNKDKVAFARQTGVEGCGGDCRAVTDMWNPNNKNWNEKPAWQWNEPGSVYYDHATEGKIYLIRASS